jgi:medium-chain acyl-[acyl-carrier-protein] hydrolase
VREPAFTELLPLIRTLAQVLDPILDIPFAIFGHSMGALISFELARQLRRQKSPQPVQLIVSGSQAPQLPRKGPNIHGLPEHQLIHNLKTLNGTPEIVLQNPELMELLLPVIRADFSICETYVYTIEDPLGCSISVFGGLQDSMTNYDDLIAWQSQTTGPFSLQLFPGGHFFLNTHQGPVLSAVTDILTRVLS